MRDRIRLGFEGEGAGIEDAVAGLEDRVGQDRGEPVEVVYFVNDRRCAAVDSPVGGAPPPTRALDLTVLTDTHLISPADVETLLRTMEAVAVEGAFDPTAPTRRMERER